jgi:hypothetical protein
LDFEFYILYDCCIINIDINAKKKWGRGSKSLHCGRLTNSTLRTDLKNKKKTKKKSRTPIHNPKIFHRGFGQNHFLISLIFFLPSLSLKKQKKKKITNHPPYQFIDSST